MASQPDYGTNAMIIDNSIDFDQTVFLYNDFYDAYNGLGSGDAHRQLNTPDLQIPNPFAPPTLGSSINPSTDTSTTGFQNHDSMTFDSETSGSSEAMDEEIISVLLDLEVNGNSTDINSHQPTTAHPEAAIEEIENDLRNAADEITDTMDFQAVMTAIKSYRNAVMRMRTQPVAMHGFRYRSDGIRYLEQSRRTPMTIELPILDGCLTKAYQSLWIQATIVTTRQNPKNKVFLHQHEMCYNAVDAQQIGLGSFRIPLTERECRRRRKTLRHLSIIKTKLKNYQFELTPFDPLIVDDHIDYYTIPNEDRLTKVKKAKRFDEDFHTNNYQIVCQLVIKQKDRWHLTDLYCETHIIQDS